MGGAKTRRYYAHVPDLRTVYALACAPTKSRNSKFSILHALVLIIFALHCYITCVSQARWIYYILLYYYCISINLLYIYTPDMQFGIVYGGWYMIMAHVKGLWYSSESSDKAMEIIT